MMLPLSELQSRVLTLLQAGHTLTVRWDCGNDESILFIDLDGQEMPFNYSDPTNFAVRLSDYLLELLELPGVGSFELRGGGRIELDGTDLVLHYQSEYTDFEGDWVDELTDEQKAALEAGTATSVVDPELSEEYSGRQVLFEVES